MPTNLTPGLNSSEILTFITSPFSLIKDANYPSSLDITPTNLKL